MLKFFTQWTKKKIIITALSLTALTTAAVGVSSIIGSGGQSDVKLPVDSINGVAEKPQNATVADFLEDHKKNLYVANGVLITAGSFRTQTTGTTVSTKIGLSITQEIRAERTVKGNDVFKQSSSYGLVKMGDQRFASGESYLYRTASKVNSVNDIVWNAAAPSALSKSGYEARYGCRGNALSAYILNDQTIIDSSYDGFDEQTGLYAFSYVLDNEKATPQILYEMKTNSGSVNFATFKSAKITVKMDENWLIHSLFTDCSYDVPIFGNTPCKEQMTETFYDVGKINALSDLPEYDYFSPHFNAAPPLDVEAEPPTPDATTALTTMFGEYLQGKPLNLKLQTTLGEQPLNANLSLLLDLDNLADLSFSASCGKQLKVTYLNEELLLAFNDVKLKLAVNDLTDILQKCGVKIPQSGLSDLLGNFDLESLLDGTSCEKQEDRLTVSFSTTVDNLTLTATLNANYTSAVDYAFSDATINFGDDFSLSLSLNDETVEKLDATDASFVDAYAVFNDYYPTVFELIDVKDQSDRNKLKSKSWSFEIQPLTIKNGSNTYSTKTINAKLAVCTDRVIFTVDELSITSSDGVNESTTALALKAAYLRESASDKIYLTVNDLTNAESELKFSISKEALSSCLNNRLPELVQAIPALKELTETQFDLNYLLKLSSALSSLNYDGENECELGLQLDLDKISAGAGKLRLYAYTPEVGKIKLTLNTLSVGDSAFLISAPSICIKADEPPANDGEIKGLYDETAAHINLDSVDGLLESFTNTAKRKSFYLSGTIPVNLSAISIINVKVNLGLEVKIDVEKTPDGKDEVYLALKLSRGNLSGSGAALAFADEGGDSYLFYNGATQSFTLMRNSYQKHKYCSKCGGYECSSTTKHLFYRSDKCVLDTEYGGKCSYVKTLSKNEFTADFTNCLLELVNFSDSIKKIIVDAVNAENKSPYGIDDVIKDYSYADSAFSVKLDLKPVDSVLGEVNLHISHDEQFNLSTLTGDIVLLDVSGVSCSGAFDIQLKDSIVGEAKELTENAKIF